MHARTIVAAAFMVGLAMARADVHAGVKPGETSRSLCFGLVADRSGLPKSLLRAVGKIESNYQPTAIHADADGTYDVGVMQINSNHNLGLEQRYDIAERILLERPCVNIPIGAVILQAVVRRGGPIWRAVCSYGAGTSVKKEGARNGYAPSSLVLRQRPRTSNRSQAQLRHGLAWWRSNARPPTRFPCSRPHSFASAPRSSEAMLRRRPRARLRHQK